MNSRSKKLINLALGGCSGFTKHDGGDIENSDILTSLDSLEPNEIKDRKIKQTIENKNDSNPELLHESHKVFTMDDGYHEEIIHTFRDEDNGKSNSSDFNDSHYLIAEEMKNIIGDVIFDSDDNTFDSIVPSLQQCNLPPIRVSETESETELFGSDFSDMDPTYQPVGPLNDSTSDSDYADNNLARLPSLFTSYDKNDAEIPSQEPQPGSSRQSMNVESITASDVVSVMLHDIFDLVWSQVKPLRRWRTANPDTWKVNVAKKRRSAGLPYVTNKKVRAAKVPKQIDCSKCKFKCTDAFNLQDRETLCRAYWDQDFVGKKNFILSRLTVHPPKRVLVERTRPRPYNTKCHFDMGTDRKQVCQKFFCSTLKIAPAVIKDAIKHRNSSGLYSNKKDPRGASEPSNKTSAERVKLVVDHINSFPTMESHYTRKQSKRKYLDCRLNIQKMYSLYLEKQKENPVSEMTYRRIFATEFNLSFFAPKKDQCLNCNKYHAAQGQNKTDLELSYQEHIKRKTECTNEKEKDKKRAEVDKNFISVSFDLQAILQIPCSMIGILYFVRKLTVYNLCIYESALPNNAYCFPWLEVHGKKGSAEIGTILLYYLTNCVPSNVTEISLFSDTCAGQNRNQYITAILLWAVNTIDNLQVIEQKFLESGHSYMEADSMHSSIESAKKHNDVFSITDWINIFKRARTKAFYYERTSNDKIMKPPYNVKQFKYNEFWDLKDLAETMMKNTTKDSSGNKINWLKIKRIKYVKDDKNVYFNYDMSNNFLCFDPRPVKATASGLRTRKGNRKSNPNSVEPPTPTNEEFRFPTLKKLYANPLPISKAKKKDLMNLCEKGVIPEEYHGWFDGLCCDPGIIDRVPDVAAGESSSEED